MTTLDVCACKRGFFTLRDCGNPATTSCQLCTRRVCDENLALRVDTRECVESAVKREEGQQPAPAQQPVQPSPAARPAVEDEDAITGRDYPYRYRRRYYSDWG